MTALDRPHTDHLVLTVDLATGRVVLVGEFDRASAHHLLDALATLVPTRHAHWELDAAGVTYCDAGGLRALAEAVDFAARLDRGLTVSRASRCVWRLLVLTGLDVLLADQRTRAGTRPPTPALARAQRSWRVPVEVHS